jgi:cleavage stimulation factor subunit 3
MAEYDPEAFTPTQAFGEQGFNPPPDTYPQPEYDNDDDDDEEEEEEDYDPSNLQFGGAAPQAPQPAESPEAEPELQLPAEIPIEAAAPFDSPVIEQKSPVTETPAKQTRTVGGFVVDDDDDEDDVPVTLPSAAVTNGQMNVVGDGDSPKRSLTETPSNTLPPPDTSIDKAAQDQGSSGVADSVPNDAAVVSSSSGAAPSHPSTSAVPTSQGAKAALQTLPSANVSLPKARLPQDRVGILEDRIAEDPRGDIDAWLSLINEHLQRNKLPEVREAYDRFFKVFPSAVCIQPSVT